MKPTIERLSPDDRRLLFALISVERDPDRRPARAMVLYEEAARGGSGAWWPDALRLAGAALGTSPAEVGLAIARIVRDQHGAMLTNQVHVILAILRNLDRWPDLDEAGRQAAIEDECLAQFGREVAAVAAAVDAHGLPVSAPDLHPPLTWGFGHTDLCLRTCVEIGALRRTDVRNRDGWSTYDTPATVMST